MSALQKIYHDCPLSEDWEKYTDEYKKLSEKIIETHLIMTQVLRHTEHLAKLDALEDIRDSLLDSATGRNHLDAKTAMSMFRILGAVILTLLLTILFLLTGQHFNLLTLFKPNL